MNLMDRQAQRKAREALAARLKDAVDAGRVKVEDAVRVTKSSPETVAGWMAGLQTPQKKAARRLERFLEEAKA